MTNNAIIPANSTLAHHTDIGERADAFAAGYVFADYKMRKSESTRESQRYDLKAFEVFLTEQLRMTVAQLYDMPDDWQAITWGIVAAFVKWQLNEGLAISTINRRLSTIKTYAALASKAGVVTTEQLTLIRAVQGYGHKEGSRINAQRPVTRVGKKKAENVQLTAQQVRTLKHSHPDTPQGRRDAFLMCLLLDHGLRIGEVAMLRVRDFAEEGFMVFERPKVGKVQRHRLTEDTQAALDAYRQDAPVEPDVPIMRATLSNGAVYCEGVTRVGLSERVRQLGKRIGIPNLSAHDCRHSWATRASRNGTSPFALQEAGGWNSLTMPRRYIDESEIANEGVKLG